MNRTKYIEVAERLEQRVRQGDYHVQPLPSERRLASEVGVSTMTVRKAVQKLLDEGLLTRAPGGRLQVRRRGRQGGGICHLALLAPAFESSEALAWQSSIAHAATEFACSLRTIGYAHADDPAILQTLREFDGVFFMPMPGPPSPTIGEMLAKEDKAVVILDHDWTEFNVPSLRRYPMSAVRLLLDHLFEIGCRSIACLNTQPEDPIVLGRIHQWRLWMARHRLQGPLIHAPVRPFDEPASAANDAVKQFLDGNADVPDAFFCITERSALGVVRALADHGLHTGRDVAVCSVNGQLTRYTVPSITSVGRPDVTSLIAACMDWMRTVPHIPWIGPLLAEPADLVLEMRDSTRVWAPAHRTA
jgi:LacI family transcriptional regulator